MSGSGRTRCPILPTNPCDRINFRASINSPKPEVLRNLGISTVLDVKLELTTPITVVVTHSGVTAGSLTGTRVNELITCMQNGFEYSAAIVNIENGNYTVQVSAK